MTRLARTFGWGDKFADDSGTTPEELCSEAVAVEPEPEPPLPEQPVRGLKNLGNSCYLNAVLQSLLAAEPFRLYLVGDAVTGEGPTTTALRNWARHMHNGNTAAVAPTKVLQAVRRAHRRFAGRSQQDAQEVLRHLLELVRLEEAERLKPKEAPPDDTLHERTISGRLSRVASRLTSLRRYRGDSREDVLAKGNAEDVEGGSISTAGEEHADGPHELRLRRMSSESLGEDKTLPDGKAHSADEGGSAGEGEGQHSRSSASPVMTKPPAEPDTLVDDVFRGKLRSTVVCLTCKAISASHEPFLDLSLHLPRGTAEEEAQAEAEAEAAEPVVMAGKTKSQKKAARRQQQIMQQLKEAEGEGDGEGDREGEGEEMGEGERGHEPGASDAGESVDGSGCGGSSVSDDGERGSEEEVASEEALAASEGWLIVDAEQLAEDESVRDRRRFSARGPLARGVWREWRDVGIEACAEQVLSYLPEERVGKPGAEGLVTCLQAFTQPELLRDADAYECEECLKEWKRTREEGKAPSSDPTPDATAKPSESAAPINKPGERTAPLPKSGEGETPIHGGSEPPPPRQPALKFMELVSLPPVLTLHLKRFAVNARTAYKVSTPVPFPLELDLTPFCGASAAPKALVQLAQPQATGSRYTLVGVVEHRGSLTGGHYIAYVRSGAGSGSGNTAGNTAGGGAGGFAGPGHWHYFSDAHVSEATEATVLAAQAFLLFYERV